MKRIFLPEPRQSVSFTLLCLISLILIVNDYQHSRLATVRSYLFGGVSIIYNVIDWPFRGINKIWEDWLKHKKLAATYHELKEKQLLLEGKLQKYSAIVAENERLRTLLQSSPIKDVSSVVTDIIEVTLDPYVQQIVINKGRYHGITQGQPLIDAKGIIGFVMEVGLWDSKVLLLTDPSFAIPIESTRNGVRAIAYGGGNKMLLHLQHIPNTIDLQEQDLLVTSGLGGRFPPGYPVGTIVKRNYKTGDAFVAIDVKPAADLHSSRQLLLLKGNS